jgi:DNA-directed RNA polymerase specialized sigma subunit
MNICCLPRVELFTSARSSSVSNAIVKEVANSKKTTQEVADILGIDISALRRMMRQGKIAAPPILFDSKTNSTDRMWSEDDIEAVRTALKTASADS